ncbi:hypothetical protein TIFTF001_024348 [Ficus carica]|uniref:RNase H type-1 domain-containing protein n=1 Tax=Ficus carica TaxID=3494 RepID=A0AA88APS8_FICCA|nr:hypothetical protein TIFTF001_024348 [Ficus carica]
MSKHKWRAPRLGYVLRSMLMLQLMRIWDLWGYGLLLGAVSRRMAGNFSPHVGECMVVREGSWFALARGYHELIVKVDALNVYRVVCSPKKRFMKANIIYDICNSCKQVGDGSVCYGFRDGNSGLRYSYFSFGVRAQHHLLVGHWTIEPRQDALNSRMMVLVEGWPNGRRECVY